VEDFLKVDMYEISNVTDSPEKFTMVVLFAIAVSDVKKSNGRNIFFIKVPGYLTIVLLTISLCSS